ncbi:MAG: hypothetical protein H0V46_03930 [Sphingomonas sp.]|nr:hypothetical protein [Sphingomonas sp.]
MKLMVRRAFAWRCLGGECSRMFTLVHGDMGDWTAATAAVSKGWINGLKEPGKRVAKEEPSRRNPTLEAFL